MSDADRIALEVEVNELRFSLARFRETERDDSVDAKIVAGRLLAMHAEKLIHTLDQRKKAGK